MLKMLITVVAAALALAASASAGGKNAGQIVKGLRHDGPVTKVKIYNAATDPNHLLGRPNGYTSCAHFVDRRAANTDTSDTFDISNGGGVEVWPTHADAQRRMKYIQSILKAAPLLGTEYDYVFGNVLLRISGILTPTQARAYKAAVARLV